MPVKVRCRHCEKVFAAPDAARGKLVKCPGCEEKVKVPAGDTPKSGSPAKPGAKKSVKKAEDDDDHEHVLKNLDLDKIEDENARVCPKCGQEIYEEQTVECPSCGLNFETGLTKEKQRGIDPKGFFKVAFKESWKFLKENKPLALRTGLYTLVFSMLTFGGVFMVSWCVNLPPRVFWMGIAFITGMVPNGWLWFLNGEIIRATMEKKERLPRINFDMFTCVALGIKYVVWRIAMGVQIVLPLVAAFLFYQRLLIPGIVVQVLGELILALMLPQVMVHMAMPVTIRGWLMHIQFQAWAKSFGACAYWCALTFVALLPSLVPAGIAGAVSYKSIGEFSGTMVYNYRVNVQKGADLAAYADALNNPKKGAAQPTEPKDDDPKYQNRPLPWKGMIVPAIGVVISQVLFGFGAVFAMRANGLLGLYFKKHLKLETMAKEVKWVSKTAKIDESDPAAVKARKKQQLIQNIVAVVAFLIVMGGVAWWFMRKPAEPAAPAGVVPEQAGQAGGGAVPPAGGAGPATPAGAAGLAPPM